MAYLGQQIPIALGTQGLRTDEAQTSLPAESAKLANNIAFYSGRIAKSQGSARYNATALGDEIVSVHDWWPTPSLQRLIAVTADGKIWREPGTGTFSTVLTGLNACTPDTCIVDAGAESAGAAKKLFILTGTNQVKVIAGDTAVANNIATPAADWTSNYPTFGLAHRGRLWAFGNSNRRHTLYASKLGNHEDFATAGSGDTALVFNVFPGEGDGLVSAYIYRGRLFLFKRPFGVYYLDDADSDTNNWAIRKLTDAFGIASPHACVQALSDLIALNSTGSITSLQATDTFGDVQAADILSMAQVEDYMRSSLTTQGIARTHSIYYGEKKIAYFTAQAKGTSTANRMIALDLGRQGAMRISLETKDQPSCLGLRKDADSIPRPMYGAKDGYVYLMDQSTYNVAGQPYVGEFQTNYSDFSQASSDLAGKHKIYDFLEVNYVPTGNWPFFVDVYVDGRFSETVTFQQRQGTSLDSFVLGVNRLGGGTDGQSARRPLHCVGKKISFRIYNGSLNENFKVERLIVSFRVSAEQAYAFRG